MCGPRQHRRPSFPETILFALGGAVNFGPQAPAPSFEQANILRSMKPRTIVPPLGGVHTADHRQGVATQENHVTVAGPESGVSLAPPVTSDTGSEPTGWRVRAARLLIRLGQWIAADISRAAIPAIIAVATIEPEVANNTNRLPGSIDKQAPDHAPGEQSDQVRQLIKQALEAPTPEQFIAFFEFAQRFRRLAVWNAFMAHIQRPGARIIASEYEWTRAGRHVLPDAVPIMILWPFSPIRFVYKLADTGPLLDRERIAAPLPHVAYCQMECCRS
jgi:hypothetical protein